MEITTSIYALLVLLLVIHHTVRKITPKKSTKLIVGLTCVAFSLGLAFIPNLNSTVAAVALIFALGANIVLQPMYFLEKKTTFEASAPESVSVDQ